MIRVLATHLSQAPEATSPRFAASPNSALVRPKTRGMLVPPQRGHNVVPLAPKAFSFLARDRRGLGLLIQCAEVKITDGASR